MLRRGRPITQTQRWNSTYVNSPTSNNTTFVSKHHTISPADLAKVVGVNGHFKDYRLKETGELHVKTCFSQCNRGNKGLNDNAWKLTIRRDGSYYCFRCGDKGNWYNLKQRLSGGRGVEISGYGNSNGAGPIPYPSSMDALDQSGGGGSGGGGGRGGGNSVDNEINHLHSNISRAQVQNGKKELVLPNQRDAFGYHIDLSAAIYGNSALSCADQAAAARLELERLEEEANRTGGN